jgi:capsular polysaccharide biosynthesis protein
MILDRVIFSDRSAAMKGDAFQRSRRTAAEAFALPGSMYWWAVIRDAVTKFSGLHEELDKPSKLVITYISRQEWGRRKLIQEDHEKLVKELYKIRDEHGVEVNVVSMDKLSHAEQLSLAGRTTIMMGVHGNGLTSLVWMKPTPQSTVIEFFYPQGFAHDYEYTTRSLGMVYHGVWNDKTFTHPELPPVGYPEGFQGNNIPLSGEAVAKLCRERLQLPSAKN